MPPIEIRAPQFANKENVAIKGTWYPIISAFVDLFKSS
jgi:hypothetical protein